ncbi:hypothetical protein BP5796_03874 [Coleophoma crateriformis]|uniref:Nephrocystin 3-like N-terminal domain-containing protein n=1 Tax=Coleophoma crateriformis TaxID=565419 RepID=A0A3D8SGR9_9HELO|nr:hypothetical protein BP5796_03874 [Coleophoma crateriformis]
MSPVWRVYPDLLLLGSILLLSGLVFWRVAFPIRATAQTFDKNPPDKNPSDKNPSDKNPSDKNPSDKNPFKDPPKEDPSNKKPKSWLLLDLPEDLMETDLDNKLQEHYNSNSEKKVRFHLRFVAQSYARPMAIITCCLPPPSVGDDSHLDSDFEGITPLYAPEDALVDIIVVPGLGGHPLGSFRSSDGWKVWTRDFLPCRIPEGRVLAYGYNSVVRNNDDNSSIGDLAKRFLGSLREFRARSKALAIAHDNMKKDDQSRDLFRSAFGLIFFGVPNLGLRHEQLRTMVGKKPNKKLVDDLITTNETEASTYLSELKQKFEQGNGSWASTGESILMVTAQSATQIGFQDNDYQNLPLETNHRDLVRFDHAGDNKYLQVAGHVRETVDKAIQIQITIPDMAVFTDADEELTPELYRSWLSLNRPPYDTFRTLKLSKAASGTLEWLTDETISFEPHTSSMDYRAPSKLHPRVTDQVFQQDDFKCWRDASESQSLLVIAPPGSGKSILSGYIIGHLEDLSKNATQPFKVIYYFCNIKNDEKDRNACAILRGLIVQLCERQKTLFEQIPKDLINIPDRFYSVSVDELWKIFLGILRNTKQKCLYCVIDGLDVYETGMDEFLDIMKTFTQGVDRDKGPVLKLLCTSRPYNHVLKRWDVTERKRLVCNGSDINTFVRSRINCLRNLDENIKESTVQRLTEKTEHTFLWLDVVIRKLENLTFPDPMDIDEAIQNSNSDLDGLYGDLIVAAANRSIKNARILVWVVYAKRPLHPVELSSAISIDPQRSYKSHQDCPPSSVTVEMLQSELGTLLDVTEDGIYLIHQSLKDYFNRQNPLQSQFHKLTELRLAPAYVCLTYLALKKDSETAKMVDNDRTYRALRKLREDIRKDYPLLPYASKYWHSHIEKLEDVRNHLSTLQDILLTGSFNTWIWTGWFRHSYDFLKLSSQNWPGQIAVEYDIGWLGELLLCREGELDAKFSENVIEKAGYNILSKVLGQPEGLVYRATMAATVRIAGNFDGKIFELLLKQRGEGVRITVDVIKAAAGNSNGDAIIELLLDRRPDDIQITEDVIKVAAGNDVNGDAIIKLLLDRRPDDVQITEDVIKVVAGNDEMGDVIIKLLLDRRPDAIQITKDVIKAAVKNWGKGDAIMKLLLDRRPDDIQITKDVIKVVAGNDEMGDVIIKLLLDRRPDAIQITKDVIKAVVGNFNSDAIIELLLDRRLDDVQITKDVIKVAAGNDVNGEVIMKLLLDRQPDDVQITEDVIKVAAGNSNGDAIIKLLLDRRPDDIQITKDVIKVAAGNSNGDAIIKLLLDRRPDDVQITEDVIKVAAGNDVNGEVIMKLLLDRQPDDVQITEDVIKVAAGNWRKGDAIIKLLLDRRPDDVQITEDVIKAAVENPHGEAVIKLLLGSVNEPYQNKEFATDQQVRQTVLLWAAQNGHKDIFMLLLNTGYVDVDTKDKEWNRTLLNSASMNGHLDVMRLLLERGADLNIPDVSGCTPLISASSRGHLDIVKLLVEKLGDKSTGTDHCSRTALFHATREGRYDVVQLLLTKTQGHLNFKDRYDSTPIFAAVRNGHYRLVELLLTTENVCLDSRDAFGQTILWWAKQCGNTRVTELILHHAQRRGIEISDGDTNLKHRCAEFDDYSGWCDVCTLCVSEEDAYYLCEVCCAGAFLVCMECFQFGFKCLGEQHELVLHEKNVTGGD